MKKLKGSRIAFAVLVVLAVVLFMLLVMSCEDGNAPGATMLELKLEEDVGRTIMPSATLMDASKYSVSGKGPGGAVFGPVMSTENTMSIRNISTGSWELTAKALNIQNNEIASGTATVDITRGENKATVVLDRMSGSGSLQLNFTWDREICSEQTMQILISIEDDDGDIKMLSRTVNVADCGAYYVINLDAGSYVLSVKVLDSTGFVGVGATDAVRILDNTRTEGDVELCSGTKPDDKPDNPDNPDKPAEDGKTQIKIRNDVSNPMAFYIDYLPKNASKGSSITLTACCDDLPAGVNAADLSYQWYINGELYRNASGRTLTVTAASGLTRYDVIVRSPVEGSLCGASLLLSIPY